MDKTCDSCEFMKLDDPMPRVLRTEHWEVVIGNDQTYFGRAYVNLRTHKGSLGSLTKDEWSDFEHIVSRLEDAYKAAFGAEPLNWGCFMNHAFRERPFNPHVHWHVFPRYAKAPVFNGVSYDDELYGNFYDDSAERIVDDKTVEQIAARLREFLNDN